MSAVASSSSAAAAAGGAASNAQPLELSTSKTSAVEATRRLLDAWNAALNAHDADALAKLYAPTLSFYGRETSRPRVIAAKRSALARTPTFTQVLSSIQLAPAAGGGETASFVKESGSPPHLNRVHGKLVIDARDGAYAIVVESDDPSDAQAGAKQTCIGAAMQVASALPEVKKEWQEAGPSARQGGVVYSEEGSDASASLGFDHDDHFESVFTIEVSKGNLLVSEYGTPLPVPAADLAKVKAACR